jgi:threonine dehydrogenase-like Zn-dependent dehydrogenase
MISSIWHTKDTTEIRRSTVPESTPSQQQVISKFSMVSTGTEKLVLTQQVPSAMQQDMAVPYMEGGFNLPIKYGYAMCGLLETGERVHLMHPHQNICIVEKESLFFCSDTLPLQRVPLISNMETVINAIWSCDLDSDKPFVICGFGNIGSLLATTLKFFYKKDVVVIEKNLWRQKQAQELGFDLYKENQGFEVAFNTTAQDAALQYCIDQASEEAQIIELSWYGSCTTKLQLGNHFHKKRLHLISSQVSSIPKKKRQEYNYYKRKQLASSILEHDIFDSLIAHIIPFHEAPSFFNSLRKGEPLDGLIYLIQYEHS